MAELIVNRGGARLTLTFEPDARLADVLKANGLSVISPCGGRGVCGKCAAALAGQVSPPNASEQRAGARLICQAVLLGDAEVILPQDREMEGIELTAGAALTPCSPMDGPYGAAVDIGTTTIAVSLYDLKSGACLFQCGMLNPQTAVAADVMGRIGAAMAGERERLKAQVTEAISALLSRAAFQSGVEETLVRSLVITGNTAMLYLLTGRDPVSLSRAPFEEPPPAFDWRCPGLTGPSGTPTASRPCIS